MDIVKSLKEGLRGDDPKSHLCLSPSERKEACELLDSFQFGINANVAIAKAVLERLNGHAMEPNQSRVRATPGTQQLEHVLPKAYSGVLSWKTDWQEEETAEKWLPKLGNLALLNQRTNVKISNDPFENKKVELKKSPYPLTKDIADEPHWVPETVEERHKKLIELAVAVWEL
jgi:hypothetical protein